VVFCYFTHEVHALAAALARKDTVVEVITGETANAERIAIRKRFGDLAAHPERTILVAQIKTISLAVNELVTASNAIFGSLSQQRDDWTQGRDRLHRIGQVWPVTFWYAVVRGTVDEVILNAHQNRLDLETQMLRYLKETA
jgi:SNF2 family DNA or RNA helicase